MSVLNVSILFLVVFNDKIPTPKQQAGQSTALMFMRSTRHSGYLRL